MVEKYYYNEECTLTAIPENCCVFSHWVKKDNPCEIVSYDNPFTFNVHDNTAYEAVFKKKKCNIKVLLNRPELGRTVGSGVYECGDTINIAAYTSRCNEIHWRNITNGNDVSFGDCPYGEIGVTAEITLADDAVFYADVTVNEIEVSVSCCPEEGGHAIVMQSGSGVVDGLYGEYSCSEKNNIYSNNGEFNCGSQITFFEQPNNGYVFIGWYKRNCIVNTCEENEDALFLSESPSYTTIVCDMMCVEARYSVAHSVIINTFGCGFAKYAYRIGYGGTKEYDGLIIVPDGEEVRIKVRDFDGGCCIFNQWSYGPASGDETQYVSVLNDELVFTVFEDIQVICVFENVCATFVVDSKGCEQSTIFTYKINGGNINVYTEPFITNIGDSVQISAYDDECCRAKNMVLTTHENSFSFGERVGQGVQRRLEGVITVQSNDIHRITVEYGIQWFILNIILPLGVSCVVEQEGVFYYGACENNIVKLTSCKDFKVWFSSPIDYNCYNSNECKICGKIILDGIEKQCIHGGINGTYYFTSDAVGSIIYNNSNELNALVSVLNIPFDGNEHTLEYVHVSGSTILQSFYFFDNPTVSCATASESDFYCPFIDENNVVIEMNDMCSQL